jgi:hypothetical protein
MAERFNLEDYETVDQRLRRLYTAYPNARVLTDIVFQDDRRFVVKAELFFDREDITPVATGFAEEIVGIGFINKSYALENCETSAIGRAVANSSLVLGTPEGKRPSRQEMEKTNRYEDSPRKAPMTKKPMAQVFTADQIAKAQALLPKIAEINDIEELRAIWTAESAILDIKVDRTTLKDTINARVKDLSA